MISRIDADAILSYVVDGNHPARLMARSWKKKEGWKGRARRWCTGSITDEHPTTDEHCSRRICLKKHEALQDIWKQRA